MTKRLDEAALGAIGVLSIAVSLLDIFGLLEGLAWFQERIPILTLLVVGSLLTFLTLTKLASVGSVREEVGRARTEINTNLQENNRLVMAALGGVRLRGFDSAAEYWSYAAEKAMRATKSIDATPWGREVYISKTKQDLTSYLDYRRALGSAAKGTQPREGVIVRELASFPHRSERIPWLQKLLGPEYPNYNLRYFTFNHDGTPALFQFLIFDQEEVMLHVAPTERGGKATLMAIMHNGLAELFASYYQYAWTQGIIIRDPWGVNEAAWQAVLQRAGFASLSSDLPRVEEASIAQESSNAETQTSPPDFGPHQSRRDPPNATPDSASSSL